MSLPILRLPTPIPERPERPTQPDVPTTRGERDAILAQVRGYLGATDLVPPVPLDELVRHAGDLCRRGGIDPGYAEFCALVLNNELWREGLAAVPYERRLLLLPKCLRAEDRCPAPFDELGLLCKKCGLCSIQELQEEAERMGYAVLVAEGSPIVMAIIETGKIEAIVGVSCLNVLRKVYPYMEAAAIPGIALPLLQDDCVDTNVDLDWVWDAVHLTSDDRTRRLDLAALREEVDRWFAPEALAAVLGPAESDVERVGQEWLARAGKRWRPFLAVAVHQALAAEPGGAVPDDLRKVAVAVECFHKASLIHDDIEDGDDLRYGRAALHAEHGVPIALNAGDFLVGEGYRLLAETAVPAERRSALLKAAARGHRTLAVGQGTELTWLRDPRPLPAPQVVALFRQKTAPAFETALALGAIYGGAGPELEETLAAYSDALGVAYQIRDDLEDLAAARRSGALPERRPTILWALAHQTARGAAKEAVTAAWCDPAADPDPAMVHRLLAELEVETRGRELLSAYKDEAVRALRRLDNPNVKGLLRRTLGKIFDDLQIRGWCHEFEARNAAGGEARTAAVG
jgi:geranylgeranyl pyrophosphate synthase